MAAEHRWLPSASSNRPHIQRRHCFCSVLGEPVGFCYGGLSHTFRWGPWAMMTMMKVIVPMLKPASPVEYKCPRFMSEKPFSPKLRSTSFFVPNMFFSQTHTFRNSTSTGVELDSKQSKRLPQPARWSACSPAPQSQQLCRTGQHKREFG